MSNDVWSYSDWLLGLNLALRILKLLMDFYIIGVFLYSMKFFVKYKRSHQIHPLTYNQLKFVGFSSFIVFF